MSQNYNIPIQTNIYNTVTKIPTDLKGKHCYVEKHITPYKKQGIWNQPLEVFNNYKSNQETVVKEYLYEQRSNPNEKVKNFADQEVANTSDYLDTILYRQVQEYYQGVETAYQKSQKFNEQKLTKEQELRITKKGEILTERVLQNLQKVRERVKKTVSALQIQSQEKNRKNQAEVQRLYKSMKEAVQHILAGEGEQKFNRMTQQLQQKEHLNCDFMKEKAKASDEKQALEFYQDLRLLASKKTDEFEILRQIHGDDFLTDTTILKELSDSGRTGDTGSVLSESLSKYESELEKQQQQDPKLAKLYDIPQLKHKWGYETEKQVKDSIRRILVRQTLSEAEHLKARQEREEQEMRQKMIKNDPNLAYLFKAQDKNKKKFWQGIEAKQKQREKEKEERRKRLFASKGQESDEEEEELDERGQRKKVNPQQAYEKKVKSEFFEIHSNALLSQGETFSRIKDYSNLFKNRAQQTYANLQFKENPKKLNEFIQATYS